MARSLLFVAGLAASLAGCAPSPQSCASPQLICAGLVTDFGPATTGLAGQAWLALRDAQVAGKLDRIDFIETVDTRDRRANIEAFARTGYDLILTVGQGISEETLAIAQEYPDLHFIGLQQDYDGKAPNLVPLRFREDEGGFLAGAAAALVTQTDRVAAVCEARFIDSVRRYCDGFEAGASYVDGAVQVDVIYRSGSQDRLFRDLEWGRDAARDALRRGADVLFAAGGQTAQAALIAAAEGGALVIASEIDPYDEEPQLSAHLLTSAVLEVRSAASTVVEELLADRSLPAEYLGSAALAPFHELEDRLAPGTQARLAQLERDLETGLIQTGIPFEEP